MSRDRSSNRTTSRRNATWAIIGLVVLLVLCSTTFSGGVWLVTSLTGGPDDPAGQSATAWPLDSAELTIAVSPLMAPVLADLADSFNARGLETPDGKPMTVRITAMQPEEMVEEALGSPAFQAISPDSSLWLDQLEQEWTQLAPTSDAESSIPIGRARTSAQTRYAVSPVVLIAWESVARDLGWPEESVGWQDIQEKATSDPDFKWNHAGTNTASGLLATLAEFYAGAGITRGLTEETATAQETLDYVEAVESTVRFYGEGEEVIVQRLAEEGRDFLDAFVGQEQVVIDWNATQSGERLVAMYPTEGSLWTDHPLALLELGTQPEDLPVTDNQRLTYAAFTDFVTSEESQQRLLASGYRPADLAIPLDSADSPFAAANAGEAVDWRQPQTTLQMPPPAVVDVVRDAWRYAKRPANVYLVVDTSGSMEGDKIDATRQALSAFVNEVQGNRDRLGIVEFADQVKNFTPLREMNEANRRDTLAAISRMDASGGTALVDAVFAAAVDLQSQADSDSINALVVMTDGLDNESARTLDDLQRQLTRNTDVRVVLFTVGFGRDADEWMLETMAGIGDGQFRRADETDIEELYRIVSTYF